MRFVAPGDASSVVEKLLDEKAALLGESFDADTLTFFGPIVDGVESLVREAMESIRNPKPRLAMVVETGGGFIEVVERMVRTIRHHYPKHVDFIVPNFAMSAGTVLVMSGDAIHMDYASILGPIDPQIPARDGRLVPATGYLRKYEELVLKGEQGQLNTAELAFLIEKFDPGELYQYERARDLSVSLLKDWLVQYKLKDWTKTATRGVDVTIEDRRRTAEEIARRLGDADHWHSHSRGISADVLRRDLRVQIDDYGQDSIRRDRITGYYRLAVDFQRKHGFEGIIHVPGTLIPMVR